MCDASLFLSQFSLFFSVEPTFETLFSVTMVFLMVTTVTCPIRPTKGTNTGDSTYLVVLLIVFSFTVSATRINVTLPSIPLLRSPALMSA